MQVRGVHYLECRHDSMGSMDPLLSEEDRKKVQEAIGVLVDLSKDGVSGA